MRVAAFAGAVLLAAFSPEPAAIVGVGAFDQTVSVPWVLMVSVGLALDSAFAADLSLVVPILNPGKHFEPLLQSLARQRWDGDWELVVVDNGSTDGSRTLAERYAERMPVRIVDARGGAGTSYARNVGAKSTDAPLLLFVDHDDVVSDGYVAAMAEALVDHPLVCARLDYQTLNAEWQGRLRPSPGFRGPIDEFGFLPWASGGTIGVRRQLFDELGGFDEQVSCVDDVDFCWRAQLLHGAQVHFVAEAVLYWRHRTTLRGMFTQARNWGRNELELQMRYRKHGAPQVPVPRQRDLWVRILRHLPRLRHRAGRAWLSAMTGNAVGRFQAWLGLHRRNLIKDRAR